VFLKNYKYISLNNVEKTMAPLRNQGSKWKKQTLIIVSRGTALLDSINKRVAELWDHQNVVV
jgi:hypothetical protein